jgi:hypothetical protein
VQCLLERDGQTGVACIKGSTGLRRVARNARMQFAPCSRWLPTVVFTAQFRGSVLTLRAGKPCGDALALPIVARFAVPNCGMLGRCKLDDLFALLYVLGGCVPDAVARESGTATLTRRVQEQSKTSRDDDSDDGDSGDDDDDGRHGSSKTSKTSQSKQKSTGDKRGERDGEKRQPQPPPPPPPPLLAVKSVDSVSQSAYLCKCAIDVLLRSREY